MIKRTVYVCRKVIFWDVERDDTFIFGKVRVADVLTPQKSTDRSVWQTAFNKISAKHFDFLLCNKDDLSFVCGIELDDKSHDSDKTKIRDVFLEEACKTANFPLVRFPAKAAYKISDVRAALSASLTSARTIEAASIQLLESAASSEANEPIEIAQAESNCDLQAAHEKNCPQCASEMKLRVAKKGSSVGNEFWGCSTFPKCQHIEPLGG